MPTDNQSADRRKLASELARLRAARGASGRDMAADLGEGWSQAKVSRTENGHTVPPLEDIEKWLRYCNAGSELTQELMSIGRRVQIEVATHRDLNRKGHAEQQRGRKEHDADARVIRIYQNEVVPGLLQAPGYMRHLLLALGAVAEETVSESVAARIDRQSIVYDEDKFFEIVVTETALAWQPGPASVSREQLLKLRVFLHMKNFKLGFVSREQQKLVLPSNSFVMTEWADGDCDVVSELNTAEVVTADPNDVKDYLVMFERQAAAAAYGDAADEILQRVLDGLI